MSMDVTITFDDAVVKVYRWKYADPVGALTQRTNGMALKLAKEIIRNDPTLYYDPDKMTVQQIRDLILSMDLPVGGGVGV